MSTRNAFAESARAKKVALPPIGTRFRRNAKRVVQPMRKDADGQWALESTGAYRVWEYTRRLPNGSPHPTNPLRATASVHVLTLIEETGFEAREAHGVGQEMRVADQWFDPCPCGCMDDFALAAKTDQGMP